MARTRLLHILLSDKERKIIRHFQKKTQSSNARTRCTIILAADENKYSSKNSYQDIAERSGACTSTVRQTIKDYLENGFYKMVTPDRNPNSDTARLKVTGDIEAKIIAIACSPAPEGYVRWPLNLLYNQSRRRRTGIQLSESKQAVLDLKQAIIWSEIVGPPRCKGDRRKRAGMYRIN